MSEFPDVALGTPRIRFTAAALHDLGCSHCLPGDYQCVLRSTSYKQVVDEFITRFSDDVDLPQGFVGKVGGDVRKLRAVGGRAAIWHDDQADVWWMLGFTADHDYTEFERRAAAQGGRLRPTEDDFTLLELERAEPLLFDDVAAPGLRKLVEGALESAGTAVRGTVGGALRLEVSALVERIGDDALADITILVRLPTGEAGDRFSDWPGPGLPSALVSIIDPNAQWSMADEHADGTELDRSEWMGVVLRSVDVGRLAA